MRITQIDIKNFRAFYGSYSIDLYKSGKNLLVYGENGSGKSSLYLALKLFLNSYIYNHEFSDYRNIFVQAADGGYLKLSLREDKNSKLTTYEWSETIKETNDTLILDAAKTSGFVDYKGLLKTYFLTPEGNRVNVFDIFINNLLASSINNYTNRTLAEDWERVKKNLPKRNIPKQITDIEARIEEFNTGLKLKLQELQDKSSDILTKFECNSNIIINFDFNGVYYNPKSKSILGQEIILKVTFCNQEITYHHHFLNEAKLSAIALSIYFASLLVNPSSKLKVLALDDVLIGLDMSHRLPVIDVLKEYFADYQIFFMTYDKAWYEMVKMRTNDKDWKYIELYSSMTDEYELPVYVENKKYLDKSKQYLDANDYKSAAIYLRTAFEFKIKQFCDEKGLKVKYQENPKKLTGEDFWAAVKIAEKKNDDGTKSLYVDAALASDVELYRSIIMNPLSHARIVTVVRKELEDAIDAVERLETVLSS